ncbi:MAG: DUF6377 domain-containing protein [Ferruginibacter sp.]
MKLFVTGVILLLYNCVATASPYSDSLVKELNKAIQQSAAYDQKKLREISALQVSLSENTNSGPARQYALHLKLYEEYRYYNYDSAFSYTKKLRTFAENKGDLSLLADAKLKQVFILLSGGMFKETFDSLNVISVNGVNDNVKAEYFSLKARCYYDLADFDDDSFHTPFYYNQANASIDSALILYPQSSFEYLYFSGLRDLKKGKTDSALLQLQHLITVKELSFHEIALVTSMMGGINVMQGNDEKGRDYLIQASIADIHSSTKETSALLSVASIIFKEGQIKNAALYIEKANADATFYKARLRKVQIGAILPLIKEELIHTIENQKQKLIISLLLLGLLVLLLACFVIIVRNQVKKLKVARLSLLESNLRQQQINDELEKANALKEKYNGQMQQFNRQLSEANKIKEEYVGYYFSIDTAFMARMEKLINTIEKKLVDRKWDETKLILKTVDLKKEKEELLKNFDKIFIKLFPDFVDQFNTLFNPEDRYILKKDQLLNTELRIFALIRMGITDNEKIAEILNYSINTIYSYKTKMRNKALIPKDDFDKKIMELTTLNYQQSEIKTTN